MGKVLEPWQGRVLQEKAELDAKIVKARVRYDEHYSELLWRQIQAMKDYSDILELRIAQF